MIYSYNMVKSLLKRSVYSILWIIILIIFNYFFVNLLANPFIDDDDKVAPHTVWLIFGTSKSTVNGGQNLFFLKRIEHAVRLDQAGKIEYIIVSGDNRRSDYDEPSDMRNALIERWIPAENIILDYAWLSTWDSVARAHTIFQAPDVLLISQQFQVQRGLVACLRFDMTCHGSASEDVSLAIAPRVYIREFAARVKLRYDFMISPSPTIWGPIESTPWNT